MTATSLRVVLLLAVLGGLSMVPSGGAQASCAGPSLHARTVTTGAPRLLVGDTMTVTGERFVEGCNDQGGGSVLGCSRDAGEEVTAQRQVALQLRQGGRTWDLGTADASEGQDRFGRISWSVRIPIDAAQGPATLLAGNAKLPVVVTGRLHIDRPAD